MGRSSVTWTVEEDSLLGTVSDKEVAVKLGRSLHSVRKRRINLGISPFKILRKVPDDTTLQRLRGEGKSLRQIARLCGTSRQAVHNHVKRLECTKK